MRLTKDYRPFAFHLNHGMMLLLKFYTLMPMILTSTRHIFHAKDEEQETLAASNVDKYNDSYARDTSVDELRSILGKMDEGEPPPDGAFLEQLSELISGHNEDFKSSPGWLFRGLTLYFHRLSPTGSDDESKISYSDGETSRLRLARYLALFGSAQVAETLDTNNGHMKGKRSSAAEKPSGITHIVVPISASKADLSSLRATIAQISGPIPHVVTVEWVEESWKEGTLLDEESELCPWLIRNFVR